jgi:competence protein ComEA
MVEEQQVVVVGEPRGLAERGRALARRLGCSPAEGLALGVLVAGAVVVLGLLWLLAAGGAREVATPLLAGLATPGASGSTPSPGPSPSTATELVVHVAGQVAAPGVHRLAGGSRVGDAIAQAGGALPDARLDALNLARPLADGEQIVVPGPGMPAVPAAGTAPEDGARRPDGLLDLNLADAQDLDELTGVGPVLAQRILDHRAELGRFTDVEQLRDVKGIGDATFAELAGQVAV